MLSHDGAHWRWHADVLDLGGVEAVLLTAMLRRRGVRQTAREWLSAEVTPHAPAMADIFMDMLRRRLQGGGVPPDLLLTRGDGRCGLAAAFPIQDDAATRAAIGAAQKAEPAAPQSPPHLGQRDQRPRITRPPEAGDGCESGAGR